MDRGQIKGKRSCVPSLHDSPTTTVSLDQPPPLNLMVTVASMIGPFNRHERSRNVSSALCSASARTRCYTAPQVSRVPRFCALCAPISLITGLLRVVGGWVCVCVSECLSVRESVSGTGANRKGRSARAQERKRFGGSGRTQAQEVQSETRRGGKERVSTRVESRRGGAVEPMVLHGCMGVGWGSLPRRVSLSRDSGDDDPGPRAANCDCPRSCPETTLPALVVDFGDSWLGHVLFPCVAGCCTVALGRPRWEIVPAFPNARRIDSCMRGLQTRLVNVAAVRRESSSCCIAVLDLLALAVSRLVR